MKKSIKIVKATAREFEAFYRLWRKTLKKGLFLYPENAINFMIVEDLPKKNLKEKISHLFLAYHGVKLIGYLLTNKTRGGMAFGHWLGVDSKFQKQGTASALLSFWEKHDLSEGAHKLWLWTTKNNIDFYKNRGFILLGEFPDSFFGLDHFLFYKTLRKSDEKIFPGKYLKKKKSV